VAQALATHAEWVQAETLATTLHQRAPGDGPAGSEASLELDDGGRVRLWLRPVPRG
jgi:hypothetical protein